MVEKEEALTEKDKRDIEKVVVGETDRVREEYLRLEALKVANSVYGGKSIQPTRLLQFAAEIYEFIKGDDRPKAKEPRTGRVE